MTDTGMSKPMCPICSGILRYIDPIGNEWIIQFVDTIDEDVGLIKQSDSTKRGNKQKDCLKCMKCGAHFSLKLEKI